MGAIYSLGIENDIHSVESDPMFPPSFSPLQQRIQALEAATRRRERKKTLAAIRCDNEAIAIASTVLRTWHHIDKALGIDDSSNDSPRIAKIDGATVITHEKNRGKAAGVSTALDCARDHGFDLLVLLDGNGQHDPDEVPGDLGPSPRRKGRSGDRLPLLQNGNGSVPTYRRLGQTIHILVTNSNSTAKITDFPSGFRGSLSSGDGELYDRLRRLLGGGWI